MDKQYLVGMLKKFADDLNISVDEEILGQIVSLSSFRVAAKGSIVASLGEDTELCGMVLSGIIRSYYIDSEGNDITRGFSPAGYMFMDEGIFGYMERICMYEAMEETTVMQMRVKDLKRLISSGEEIKNIWIFLLEHAIRYKIYRENGFLVENATERYVHFKKMFPELSERVPQKHIATYLGITPESLSRIRSAMKDSPTE